MRDRSRAMPRDAQIARDVEEPRVWRFWPKARLQAPPGLQIRVLQDILGLLPGAERSYAIAVDPVGVLAIEIVDRLTGEPVIRRSRT